MIRVKCEHCDAALKVKDRYAGQTINCPGCQGSIRIPSTSQTEAEPPTLEPRPPGVRPSRPAAVGPIIESAPSPDRIIVVNNDSPAPPPARSPQPPTVPFEPVARESVVHQPVDPPPVERPVEPPHPVTPAPVQPAAPAPVEAQPPASPIPIAPKPIVSTAEQPKSVVAPAQPASVPFAPTGPSSAAMPAPSASSPSARPQKKSGLPLWVGASVAVVVLAAGAWLGGLLGPGSSGGPKPSGDTLADSPSASFTPPAGNGSGSFGDPAANVGQSNDTSDNSESANVAPQTTTTAPVPEIDDAGWAKVHRTIDRFGQIAIAFVNYCEVFEEYSRSSRNHPPEMFQADGTPNLSWRVELLPWLDHGSLYREFRQDEPWDSPHNLALAEHMPDVFRLPGDDPDSTTTRIRVIAGEKQFSGFTSLFPAGTSVRPQDITDTLVSLVVAIQAGPDQAVPWTKPGPLDVDAASITKSLGDVGGIGRAVATADGEALLVRHDADNTTWQHLLSPTDGDVLLNSVKVPLKQRPHPLDSWEPPEGPLAFACLSDSCVGVVSIRVRDALDKKLARDFLEQSFGSLPDAPEGLEEVAVWFPFAARETPAVATRFREPLTLEQAEVQLGIDAKQMFQLDDRTILLIETEAAHRLREPRDSRTPFEQRVMTASFDTDFLAILSVEAGLPTLHLGEPFDLFMPMVAAAIPPNVQQLELRLDVADSVVARLTGHVADEREAKRLKGLVSGLVRKHGRDAEESTPKFVTNVMKWARVVTDAGAPRAVTLQVDATEAVLKQLVADLNETAVDPLLTSSIIPREAPNPIHLRNNLKQLSLGVMNHVTAMDRFPPGDHPNFYDDEGKPLLSWRVHVLPQLELFELYKKFKLDEPWDSPHNIKLIEHMPFIYETPGVTKAGYTSVMTFSGPGTPFLPGKPGPKWGDITDGEERTIFAVRAGADKAVPWTKPEDITLDSKDPIKGLGNFGPVLDALTFGSDILQVPDTVSATELLSLITPRSEERDPDFIASMGVPEEAGNIARQVRITRGPARFEMHDAICAKIAFASEGTLAVAVNLKSGGTSLRVFGVGTPVVDLLGEIPLPFDEFHVEASVATSPDGHLAAVTAGDNRESIVLCDLRAMQVRWQKTGFKSPRSPEFSPNGAQLMFTDVNAKVYLVSSAGGDVRTAFDADESAGHNIHAVTFAPGTDSTAIAAMRTLQNDGSKTLSLLKINLKSGKVDSTLPLTGWDGAMLATAFEVSSDGRFALIGQSHQEGHVALVSLANGQILKELPGAGSFAVAMPRHTSDWVVHDTAGSGGNWELSLYVPERGIVETFRVYQELISVSINPTGNRTAVAQYKTGNVIIFDTSRANRWKELPRF